MRILNQYLNKSIVVKVPIFLLSNILFTFIPVFSDVFYLDLNDFEVQGFLEGYSEEEINNALSIIYSREQTFSSDAVRMYYEELADFIKKRGLKIGVEVGVLYAGNSEYILQNTEVELLYSVDPFDYAFFGSNIIADLMWIKAKKRLDQHNDRSILIRDFSNVTSKNIPDNSLDFVFLDGDHEEHAVMLDLKSWYRKIKKGGIIMGDDYHPSLPGVIIAVNKFSKKNCIELNFFGFENRIWWAEKNRFLNKLLGS